MRMLSLALAVLALPPFNASIRPLSAPLKSELIAHRDWHRGCPVPLSGLRLLTVTAWGFDGKPYRGQLVVNERFAVPLAKVFRRLYSLRFPLRDLTVAANYGSRRERARHPDASGSFECRQAVPSPCTGGTGTGSWSMHAYGEAVDLNPVENPYVGCGMSRDKAARSYMDRSTVRPGMVKPAVVRAFASIGWGWGGSWSGSTKDYMHFSANGH
ncbi:MAG: M15 family metallopeptidase [Actinobacteria bacterium]|nr:MAG: M15 family metallopeptidase [Actinomycetota bacterium]